MTSVLLMPLLNEGADVWRSVVAEPLEDGTYQILGPMPDDEEWTFAPGRIVASQLRTFGNGEEQLVAMPPPPLIAPWTLHSQTDS